MIIHPIMFFLAANPFIDSFFQSDWIGKGILLSLLLLSIVTWALLIQKIILIYQVRGEAHTFSTLFKKAQQNPLSFETEGKSGLFFSLYSCLKTSTMQLLNKNRHFKGKGAFLSRADLDYIEAHGEAAIQKEVEGLQTNLYLLSTIVTLAPFLGLLGTVWGILITFSSMQESASLSSQSILGGLALALTTTVLGLIVAIPALIGYNAIRTAIGTLESRMELLTQEMLASIELQYRQVDVAKEEATLD